MTGVPPRHARAVMSWRPIVAGLIFAACFWLAVARDANEVLACLDYWKIPRKRRVKEAA